MVYSLNGDKKAVNTNSVFQKIPLDFKNGKTNISISNSGKNLLYVRVIRQGQAPQGVNPPIKNNTDILTMRIVYKTLKGKLINPSVLPQGTDFVAEVTLNNPGKRGFYQQMALTQIFPSGWEIINTRLSDASVISGQADYTYRDSRDDRVLTYFNIAERQTLIYQVLLNAAYLGKYYLPAVSCEAMYNHNIQAMEAGKWVQVVK
jgi:alpha-2-macroglobulin